MNGGGRVLRRLWGVLAALLLCTLILQQPQSAAANSAPPRWSGDKGAMLLPGSSNQVHVKSETLTFDMADDLAGALVTARYQMENRGGALSDFAVVFVVDDAGANAVESLKATWNGTALAVTEASPQAATDAQAKEMEQAWGALDLVIDPVTGEQYSTKDFFGQGGLRFAQFKLNVAAGESGTLEVQYKHAAARDRSRHAHDLYHYQYLLSPAKGWASFGPLEIRVRNLTEKAAYFKSNLPFQAENGEYVARFDGLPQQNLTFGVMSRKGLFLGSADTGLYYLMAFLIFLVAAGLVGWLFGWVFGAIRQRGWAVASAIAAGLVLGGILDVLLAFGIMALFPALSNDGYGVPVVAFGELLLGVPVTMVFAGVKAARRNRARNAASGLEPAQGTGMGAGTGTGV